MELTVVDPGVELQSLIKSSGLFDSVWYSSVYEWVTETGHECLEHYVKTGEKNNRFPNKYFDPGWYRRKYLSDSKENISSLLHYHQKGRFLGFAPSPMFDPVKYAEKVGNGLLAQDALNHWIACDRESQPPCNEDLKLECEVEHTGLFMPRWYENKYMEDVETDLSPLEHYCSIGSVGGNRPNPYFDEKWYVIRNPHVTKSGLHPLLHYARHGWRNGKDPSTRFDAQSYLKSNLNLANRDEVVFEPLNHFLVSVDLANDRKDRVEHSRFSGLRSKKHCDEFLEFRDFLAEPGFGLLRFFSGEDGSNTVVRRRFSDQMSDTLKKNDQRWLGETEILETFVSVYHPTSADGLFSSKVLDDFVNFVRNFANASDVPQGIFDPYYYREVTNKSLSNSECLMDWVLSKNKFIPNQYFKHEIYRKSSGSQLEEKYELFRDWLYNGVYENRFIGDIVNVNYIAKRLKVENSACAFFTYLMTRGVAFNRRCESIESGRQSWLGHEFLAGYFKHSHHNNLRNRLHEGALHDQIISAAKYDSKIIQHGFDKPFSSPPFNTILAPIAKKVRCALSQPAYDVVVLIPHCRMSGATKIAGKFTESIMELGKDSSVLVVITDLDVCKYPEWFPDQADVYTLCTELVGLEGAQKQALLYDLLIGVNPAKIFNFNSSLGWALFENYGARLASNSSLYTYYFCYDVNVRGVKVGYPSMYFVSTLPHMKRVFFDSDYLRNEVSEKNMIAGSPESEKLTTLYTPVIDAEIRYEFRKREKQANKIKIYWAGRLDRQKNFDLVCRIADCLPEIEFHCWGESVIGDYNVDEHMPGNVQLQPPFRNIDEINIQECDLWLYTARWDGIPNLILEVGVRGIPLVSTRVWGIADILDEKNSWVVDEIENEDSYVETIFAAMNSELNRRQKSEKLREQILTQHSPVRYTDSILNAVYETENDL